MRCDLLPQVTGGLVRACLRVLANLQIGDTQLGILISRETSSASHGGVRWSCRAIFLWLLAFDECLRMSENTLMQSGSIFGNFALSYRQTGSGLTSPWRLTRRIFRYLAISRYRWGINYNASRHSHLNGWIWRLVRSRWRCSNEHLTAANSHTRRQPLVSVSTYG